MEKIWQTNDERLNAQVQAAFTSVWLAFTYLDRAAIISPAAGDNVGAFARQCFFGLMVDTFHMPKKRLASLARIDLKKVRAGCQHLREQSEKPRFARWYDRLSIDAAERFADWERLHG